MRHSQIRRLEVLSLIFFLLLCAVDSATAQEDSATTQSRTVIEGTVRDTMSGDAASFAVIRIVGTDSSTIADARGRFRLTTASGNQVIEVRKIGYRMLRAEIDAVGGRFEVDLHLRPLPTILDTVIAAGIAEPAGNRIMRSAIARKNDVLSRINDYRYEAYVKLVVRDLEKEPDSASSVFLITETQTTAYWEQPDHYQEVITARRQSRNIDAENNLVTVGQIVNFNRDRIDLAQYSVVSPTADDALEFYDYHIMDSLQVDGRKVFRLAIVPKSSNEPYFAGMVDIADSTYDVLAIDVGTNEAMRFDLIENVRYRQRMANHGDDSWMPSEILFSFEVRIRVPLPGIPEHLHIEHIAALDDYRFDEGDLPGTVREYALIVEPDADEADSASWIPARRIPLGEIEHGAYARIDSIESEPANVGDRLLQGLGLAFLAANTHDFFHFNRVEGAYLGAGRTWRDFTPNAVVRTKLGYSFAQDRWQYNFGARLRLSERRRIWVGAWYRNEVVRRPTLVSSDYNPTAFAVLGKSDPHHYFVERGLTASVSAKLVNFTTVDVTYQDLRQASLETRSEYSVFDADDPTPPNEPINDGLLRSMTASVSYDSRPLVRLKGRNARMGMLAYTRITAAVEHASPSFLPTDFDYTRFSIQLQRRQRTLGLGLTRIDAYAGISTGDLPPQRLFMVDYGTGQLFETRGFNTLSDRNFAGDRIAMVLLSHNFDRLLFRKTGLPLIRDIPFTLAVFGRTFWTDRATATAAAGEWALLTAPSAYTEVGFGLGNLTPMIAPFNFGVYFSWQLSDYATEQFEFRFGIPTP